MADWNDLGVELSAWRETGRTATFWWRDDDAIEPTEALTRMLDLVERHRAALGLAVIPKSATPDLSHLLKGYPTVSVLQHGYAHINHEPDGQKRAELGPHRDQSVLLEELTSGFSEIKAFEFAQPVLVPPWNRIDSAIYSRLPALGYKAVSTNESRKTDFAAPGLISIGAHADIIDWRGTRGFIGTSSVLGELIEHLKARRFGHIDVGEPTGLLTHHLVHDDACWAFVDGFLNFLKSRDSTKLVSIAEVLAT